MIGKFVSWVHRFIRQHLGLHIKIRPLEAHQWMKWQSKPPELQETILFLTKTLGFSPIRPSRGKW
jgi:hypothetical protein